MANRMHESARDRGDEPILLDMHRLIAQTKSLLEGMQSGKLMESTSNAVNDQRVVGLRALYAEDDIQQLQRRLAQVSGPPEIDELKALYETNGPQLADGLEGMDIVAKRLVSQADENTPNWRRRRDGIQDLFGRLSRLVHTTDSAIRTHQQSHLMNKLELVRDGAQKIDSTVRHNQIMPQKSIKALTEQVGEVLTAFGGVFGEVEDTRQVVTRLRSMVQETQTS